MSKYLSAPGPSGFELPRKAWQNLKLIPPIFSTQFATFVTMLTLLSGCSSLPPIMQRWAGLEIASFTISNRDPKSTESYSFSDDGSVELPTKSGEPLPGPKVSWRVRDGWLEIDTTNDGMFKKRLRPIAIDQEHWRITAVDSEGRRSLWDYASLKICIGMMTPTPLSGGFAFRAPPLKE